MICVTSLMIRDYRTGLKCRDTEPIHEDQKVEIQASPCAEHGETTFSIPLSHEISTE